MSTFETDSDRLAMIRGLGGVSMISPRGPLEGLFESDYVGVGDVAVDSSSPRLTARSSDISSLAISSGVALQHGQDVYFVRSVQPDGSGMTTLVLEGP